MGMGMVMGMGMGMDSIHAVWSQGYECDLFMFKGPLTMLYASRD